MPTSDNRKFAAVVAIALCICLQMAASVSNAQSPANGAGNESESLAERCEIFQYGEFSKIVDAPTQLTASRAVGATADLPAYCQVQGYIAPNIGFELRLPTTSWNGKFFYAGCTGHCGIAANTEWPKECDYPLTKGYACIVSDMGHRSTTSDGLWAYQRLDAKVDFAFRATHRAAVAGKAITAAFYSKDANRSYYMGCSTGGRQGLVAAQRFPWDFDGIIVGAPVLSQGGTSMDVVWALQAMYDEKGVPVFDMPALQLLHEAAVAASDEDDGLKDGIVGNPNASKFDPHDLVCRAGQTRGCLTAAQAETAAKLYAGPMTSQGKKIKPGSGNKVGSELGWSYLFPAPDDRIPTGRAAVHSTRYMVTDWGPDWKFSDFDFDRDYQRLGEGDSLYAGDDPDLREFKAAGGKLMLYEGLADPVIAPGKIADYYETTQRTMGGREATESFFRLFMVPGMPHCFGGKGAFAIDYISAMEAWVERGVAPDKLHAAHLKGNHESESMIRRFPMDKKLEVFTRPVFPYPKMARYKGTGDPNDAASFEAVDPTVARSSQR